MAEFSTIEITPYGEVAGALSILGLELEDGDGLRLQRITRDGAEGERVELTVERIRVEEPGPAAKETQPWRFLLRVSSL